MKKQFGIIKVGYSAGIVGCTNEFFTLVYIDKLGELRSKHFKGMYGEEHRVGDILKGAGYNDVYIGGTYGQLKGEMRSWRGWKYGNEVIKELEEEFKEEIEASKEVEK